MSLVLVTGISGYLGAHVVQQLVEHGYRVRGTVRSAKLARHKELYKVYGDSVEVVAVDDLAKGSFTDILEGVTAVIHQASPTPGRAPSVEEALDGSIDGSLNILGQAEKAGIKNFSYASSLISFTLDFSSDRRPVKDDEWLPITREALTDVENPNPRLIYAVQNVLSERAVWDFVDKHPHVELTSINPTYFYGPWAPGYDAPFAGESFNPKSFLLSSMGLAWGLILPKGAPPPDFFVDVRDVARALVLALKAPPASQVGRKRILLSSDRPQPSEIIALITQHRPELLPRLNERFQAAPDNVKPFIDIKRAKEVLGLEIIDWKKTILDSVDALLEMEEAWKARGKPIEIEKL
ncbi:hypothetical protein EIP91_001387 [Steccherinum ochraceum]|uniref:NAD-dependent epimerase/dehydratase domain-containing protein n=1 Tax=Steccherinum ochraceum TaxID=92696 RepID=A0A4R0RGH7_9APHY|nr:hypothetical protein EIP91_001387 [Steccherinum ochraceum]